MILLFILGIGIDVMMIGAVWIVFIAAVFSELLFLYFAVRLLLSKKASGKFTRIGRTEKGRYDSAFYSIDGTELPNVFPAEVVMKDRLYDTEKAVRLRIDAGKKFVYDRNARLTIILGVPLTTILCAFLVFCIRLFA